MLVVRFVGRCLLLGLDVGGDPSNSIYHRNDLAGARIV